LSLGWAVVGGMSLGTLLTLFVILAVYRYLGARHNHADEAETGVAHAHQQPAE
jgi:multidrug efflux pump